MYYIEGCVGTGTGRGISKARQEFPPAKILSGPLWRARHTGAGTADHGKVSHDHADLLENCHIDITLTLPAPPKDMRDSVAHPYKLPGWPDGTGSN